MSRFEGNEHHFRVVRFFTNAGKGSLKEVVGEHLLMAEAEALAAKLYEHRTPDEEIAIQDEDKVGLEAEMAFGTDEDEDETATH